MANAVTTRVSSFFNQKKEERQKLSKERIKDFHQSQHLGLRDQIENVESEEGKSVEGGASSDEISNLCDSDCSGCEERLRKHRAKELYQRLKDCESGDVSRLESIQDHLAE